MMQPSKYPEYAPPSLSTFRFSFFIIDHPFTAYLSLPSSFIHVLPFAASSTGNTSLAYSSIPLQPPHNCLASATQVPSPPPPPLPPVPFTSLLVPGFSMSGPKYGALYFPNMSSIAWSCSAYPSGMGTSISILREWT